MKRRLWIVVPVIVLLAVLLARSTRSAPPDVPTTIVRKETLARRVTAEGTLEAKKATPLSAPSEAQGSMKIGWIIDDQSPVKGGDVLIRFDPTDYENERRLGSVDQQKTENRATKSSADKSATSTNLGRDARQADMELRAAQQFAFDDPDVYSRYQRVESEIDKGLASEKKEHAQSVRSIRGRLADTDAALIAIDRRKADLRVQQAEKALGAMTVTAPHDGIVVLKRDWRGELPAVGSTVWSGTPLAEIPQLDAMKAEVFVLEADASGIKENQRANVTVESLPGRTFAAKVARVDKVAKPRFRGVPVQYFGVTLEFEGNDPALRKPGARVRATIELQAEKDAITIPRQAVFEIKGKKSVWVRRGSDFVARPVELGSSSAGRVLITKGLSVGDEVALRDPKSTSDATARKESAQ